MTPPDRNNHLSKAITQSRKFFIRIKKMLKTQITEAVAADENAKTEFKRDDARPERLAREIVSFANMNGGRILLGVEDDGTVSGIRRENLQAWLMDTVIGRYVTPPIIPDYEEIATDDGRIAVVDVPMGAAKPYAVRRGDKFGLLPALGQYPPTGVPGAVDAVV